MKIVNLPLNKMDDQSKLELLKASRRYSSKRIYDTGFEKKLSLEEAVTSFFAIASNLNELPQWIGYHATHKLINAL
jgi:hypothetical protein